MKRLLYGTTALVAAGTLMAGPASAAGFEASLNGYMEQWFGFADSDIDSTGGGGNVMDVGFNSDTEVHFNAVIVLDNGLKIQYHVELEGNTSGDQIDESYLRTTASWGQIVFGSENSATYLMAYGPKEFGITANSGDTTAWLPMVTTKGASMFRTPFGSRNNEVDVSCNDESRLTYFTPRFSGFQFGVSYTSSCGSEDAAGGISPATTFTSANIHNVVNLGANFVRKFDQVDVAIALGYGFGEKPDGNSGDDPQSFHAGFRVGFGGFSIGAHYNEYFDAITSGGGTVNNETWGASVGVAYETGPWHFSAVYWKSQREGAIAISNEDELDTVQVSLNYDLGPGVQLRGTIGWADYDDETPSAAGIDNEGWYVVGGMALSF